jgi:hypothetical protein
MTSSSGASAGANELKGNMAPIRSNNGRANLSQSRARHIPYFIRTTKILPAIRQRRVGGSALAL